VNAVLNAVGVPLTELFFSQNDAWFNLRLCLWWTIPTWTLGTYAVYHYGLWGFAIFQAVLQSTWLLAFLHARRTEGLRVFAPLREPFLLSTGLVLGNLLLMHTTAVSSLYRLGTVLVIEALICGAFLIRMLLSWRSGSDAGGMEPAAVQAE
jgi:hypothetical protein